MPLFIQSLPLSLSTFWRYLILLPFLALATVLILFATAFVPLVGFLLPGMASAFVTLIGLRCALAAKGYANTPDLGKLVGGSLLFSLLNIFVSLLVTALFVASQMALTLAGLETGAGVAMASLILPMVLLTAYSCAMAVPMTATAVAATDKAQKPDPFWGFGAGLFSIAVPVVLGVILTLPTGLATEIWLFGMALYSALVTALSSVENPEPWGIQIAWGAVILSTLILTWFSSWFFATAVLAWEKTKSQREERRKAPAIERVSSDSLRALREARERGQRGPMG
ncbi:hypothetical protein [Neogemmobacter tilapiae]|uniref:Uncharacterized protein n=1 Tax=Neogemmobacter tilapiae TaxID=875041 RepID=A0A918TJE2_9RHOB|nr:hypothetical protein [Gemmobacter tilapiae]GHC49751.1 hypothetical protein GCM10007315_09940 [Gemmobacter tilapiae]